MITTNIPGWASEIQICPWFLASARGWKASDWKYLKIDFWGGLKRATFGASEAVEDHATIDGFRLADLVVLHEVCRCVIPFESLR